MTRTSLLSTFIAALAILVLAAPGAQAASCSGGTIDYSGPANGSWNVPGNWSTSMLPTTSDVVCIAAGKGTISVTAAANAKTVQALSGLAISPGSTLSLADANGADASTFTDLSVPAGATLATAGSSITISGTAVVNGLISRNPLISDALKLTSGTLSGAGEIQLPFNNVGGTLQPGGAGTVGTMTFDSLYSQQLGATLAIDLASDASFDKVSVPSNDAFFAGHITVTVLGSYAPAVGTVWHIVPFTLGADFFDTVTPSASFTAQTVPNGVTLTLSAPLVVAPPPTAPTTPATPPTPPTTTTATTDPVAPTVNPVVLGCTKRKLVLNDVLERQGRVALAGAADASLIGQQVTILFNGTQKVAVATVGRDGQFTTTAPLPPAALRTSNSARYTAVIGSQRSLDLKLVRRLILAEPTSSHGKVTLTGQVVAPLARPVATVTVSQQVACGKTTVVMRFKPGPGGRFRLTLPAPVGGTGVIYRLSTSVRHSAASSRVSPTFSLPLPTIIGAVVR